MSQPSEADRPSVPNAAPAVADAYRFVIDYVKTSGERLGPVAVEPDFQAAKEWAAFTAMRRGALPPVMSVAEGTVLPVWSEELGAPYCRGFRVEAPGNEGDEVVSCEFPRSYFRVLAERGATEWVEKGELEVNEEYVYQVCAYPTSAEPAPKDAQRNDADAAGEFGVEAVPEPLPLESSQLASFRETSNALGDLEASDVPVFIPQTVVDEASALAAEAGKQETGGVLVGKLHCDGSEPEIFVEISAQIPARYAEATGTRFSFTPETWAAADAAIALRGRDELILGWWHSHPRFCNTVCPEERQRACLFAHPFFSSEDLHLHRVCFPQAYQIALLISDLPGAGTTPALFGWRAGMVSARGYCALS